MTEPYLIRPATAADIPLLLRFIRDLAAYERLEDQVSATEALLEAHMFGPTPRAEALVACKDGCDVGFMLYFYNFSTFLGRPGLYVEDVFVLPEYRGQGVGQALFDAVIRRAGEQGCGRVCWQVLDWNEPAIGFYRRLGAKPRDGWITYMLEM